jgi:hypothetical protein
LSREQAANQRRESHEAQESQQAQKPNRLEDRQEEGRRQYDDDDLQWVLADPLPLVGDDPEHHHGLHYKGGPYGVCL